MICLVNITSKSYKMIRLICHVYHSICYICFFYISNTIRVVGDTDGNHGAKERGRNERIAMQKATSHIRTTSPTKFLHADTRYDGAVLLQEYCR